MRVATKTYTILSDDVRLEQGGKPSIMGIYYGRMLLHEMPALLPKISFSIFLEGVKTYIPEAEFRLITPKMKPVKFGLSPPEKQKIGGNAAIHLSLSPFQVEAPGDARIEIRFKGEKRPTIVYKFKIELAKKPKKG